MNEITERRSRELAFVERLLDACGVPHQAPDARGEMGDLTVAGRVDHHVSGVERLLADLVESCGWVAQIVGEVPADAPVTAEEYRAAIEAGQHVGSVAIHMRNRLFLDSYAAAKAHVDSRRIAGES